jgi:ribosome biogenesis protein ENP2
VHAQVNAELAARLLAAQGGGDGDGADAAAPVGDGSDEEGDGARRESSRAAGGSANILRDQRFAALFSDTNFTVDESDPMYKTLHPNAPPVSKRASQALLREHYEAVDDNPEDDDDDEEEEEEEEEERRPAARRAPAVAAPVQPRMFAARGEAEAAAFAAGQSLARARAMPLGQRANADASGGSRKVVRHGAQELTWVPGAGREGGGGRNGGGDKGGRGRGGRGGAGRGGGDEQKQKSKRRRMQFQK